MTTLSHSRFAHETPAFQQRLGARTRSFLVHTALAFQRSGQCISDFVCDIERARTLADRYQTFSRLSDSQLARRGLKREDIPRVVFNSRIRL